MFAGEDDDDFTPNPSSKLASLFGFGKSSDEGNTSLTYTAPKQPKKSRGESQVSKKQENVQATSSPAKLSIIMVKAVHTYKLTEGNYNAQGKLGAAVLGNASTKVYQLLLYKGKQQHVASCRITPQFQFVVQPNNYATFYDDQTQNWSMMFETSEDAIDFAREIGLARGNAMKDSSEHKLLTQDLLFGVGPGAIDGDLVEVRYIVYPMNDGKLGQEVENTTQAEKPLRVKLKKDSWEEGLLGAAKGSKRMIMLSPALTGPWRSQVPHDTGVMVQVDVGRIKTSRTDSGDSTDDTSIRARGASISEALTNSPKTHKASIISRMARMGQATLPLKGAIPCNPSDSEETEEESSVVNKAPAKVRVPKTRPAPEKQIPNVMLPPQQVAVYQQLPVSWQQAQAAQPPQQHQFVRTNGSVTYMQPSYPLQTVSTPQMFPVSTPPAVPSPESHLSVFLAETRTQNSEVRMGVAKVVDKVDQVLMKLDTMQQLQQRRESSAGVIEPSSLLVSIQKLVNENESLKVELEEKRSKIDQLYSMLHSNMMESRHDSVVFTLQQEKAQLSADLEEVRSKRSLLETYLSSRDEELVSSRRLVEDKELKLEALQKDLDNCREKITDLVNIHEEELKKVNCEAVKKSEHDSDLEKENAALKQTVHDFQEELKKVNSEAVKMCEHVSSLEKENAALKQTLHGFQEEQKKKTGHVEHIQHLKQEIVALKEKIREMQTLKSTSSSTVNEVKKVMNVVYHQTAGQFSADSSYNGSDVKQVLMSTIRDVTLKYLEIQSKDSSNIQREEEQKGSEAVAQRVPADHRVEEKQKSNEAVAQRVPADRHVEEEQKGSEAVAQRVPADRRVEEKQKCSEAVAQRVPADRRVEEKQKGSEAVAQRVPADRRVEEKQKGSEAVSQRVPADRRVEEKHKGGEAVAQRVPADRSVEEKQKGSEAVAQRVPADRHVEEKQKGSEAVAQRVPADRRVEEEQKGSEAVAQRVPADRHVEENQKGSEAVAQRVPADRHVEEKVQSAKSASSTKTQDPLEIQKGESDKVATQERTEGSEKPAAHKLAAEHTGSHEVPALEKQEGDKTVSASSKQKSEETGIVAVGEAASDNVLQESESSKPSGISKDCDISEVKKEEPHAAAEAAERLTEENISNSSNQDKKQKDSDGNTSEAVQASKDKQSRDSSLERSWRPQPPPPPLFDDDDDDDDWLS